MSAHDQPTEQRTPVNDSDILQMMIAEHTNLQMIRSDVVSDTTGRTNIFLGTLSSAVVALAFIGQVSGMEGGFLAFALILLPAMIFIGWVSFMRTLQSNMEDMVASRGINRIRHYYTEIAPHMQKYFILSTHDDLQGMFTNLHAPINTLQVFVSTPGLVGVLNSLLIAVFVGLLVFALFHAAALICIAASVVCFGISIALHLRYHDTILDAVEKGLIVIFPSPTEEEPL